MIPLETFDEIVNPCRNNILLYVNKSRYSNISRQLASEWQSYSIMSCFVMLTRQSSSYVETSQTIWRPYRSTGFYMRRTLIIMGLNQCFVGIILREIFFQFSHIYMTLCLTFKFSYLVCYWSVLVCRSNILVILIYHLFVWSNLHAIPRMILFVFVASWILLSVFYFISHMFILIFRRLFYQWGFCSDFSKSS